ncbi:MAG: glycoside hydrolase family 2 TIM barrel-domain containing protein [Bacteroidota bacterium]
MDSPGQTIDDFSLVTGLRKTAQIDGTFYLNDTPTFLHGANWTDYMPFPIDRYEQPKDVTTDWLVRTLQSLKAINGNVLRVRHQHKVNKEVLLSLCDQLGVLVIYQTDASVQPWQTDMEELQQTIHQYKHHPSILMWQGADDLEFNSYTQDAQVWMDRYHKNIRLADTTRLIALTGVRPNFGTSGTPNDEGTRLYDANYNRYRLLRNAGSWLADDVVRVGNDPTLSYGADWNNLRTFPISSLWDTLRSNYLNSQQHLYIDVHSEGMAGQENPLTVKGSPYRYSESYASPYIRPMLETELVFEDWIVTQAWQGFTAYEAYRKKRWLGYDGLLWGALMNGGDPTALLDAEGYLKLAARMCKMAAQPTLAGSFSTDVAYSKGETIPVFLTHIGNSRRSASVQITVKNVVGEVLQRKTLAVQNLTSGNTTVLAGEWVSTIDEAGWYLVEYEVR